ncbi:FkbM family methyltransferase [Alienimonas sp. DA493]|uniref:FkbM family methyltransferase n=1 Tax=Alienimonas sp. DA493 TaxID=3373605 RepID=UPI00375407B4
MIYLGEFERFETEFFCRYLQPGDVVYDVGANIGLFSVLAAGAVGPSGRVVAFEPAARPYSRLLENVKINGFDHVLCLQQGLSDQAGKLTLASGVGADAWNSFGLGLHEGNSQFKKVSVGVGTLDAAFEEDAKQGYGPPRLVKIDVEGWEGRVLAGMKRLFASTPPEVLQVEFNDHALSASASSADELFRQLNALGYEICRYCGGAELVVVDGPSGRGTQDNLFAVRNREAVLLRLVRSVEKA